MTIKIDNIGSSVGTVTVPSNLTVNKLPKAIGITSLGDSRITDDGSVITIPSPTFTGIATNAIGSFSAPSYTFTGRTNTGLFSPNASQVALAAGGFEIGRFQLDSNSEASIIFGTAIVDLYGTGTKRLLRMIPSSSWNLTWSDSVATSYFQVGQTGTNYAAFSAALGSAFTRLAFVAFKFQITNIASSITAPTDYFQIDDNNTYRFGVTQAGKVGIGQTPTALLHIKAGSTAASSAPIKLTSGSLMTSAEAGAIEFLTDAYYGTITTGAARKTFAFLESPDFTGNPTAPTQNSTDNSTKIATTAFITTALNNTLGLQYCTQKGLLTI